MRLEGKRALITGAGRGIGAAIAEAYLREGATVAVADVNLKRAQTTAEELGDGALPVHLDVTRAESIDAAIRTVLDRMGGLDILVNNAGIFDLAAILDITRQSYARIFAVNVEGLLFMLQAGARAMIEQGTGGKIINVASVAGRRGEALATVYAASKAAVISITQSAGLDLIKHRINVNAMAPGVVDSDLWDEIDRLYARVEQLHPGEKKRRTGAAVPLGRMADPEDLTGTAVFLASRDSDYMVAQTLNVDGGVWTS